MVKQAVEEYIRQLTQPIEPEQDNTSLSNTMRDIEGVPEHELASNLFDPLARSSALAAIAWRRNICNRIFQSYVQRHGRDLDTSDIDDNDVQTNSAVRELNSVFLLK